MRRMLLLLTAALVLFAGGIAIGQTPTDTFTGCLTPGGDLKNVAVGDTPTSECKGQSVEVTWNAQGPEGPVGPEGPQGPPGPGLAVPDILTDRVFTKTPPIMGSNIVVGEASTGSVLATYPGYSGGGSDCLGRWGVIFPEESDSELEALIIDLSDGSGTSFAPPASATDASLDLVRFACTRRNQLLVEDVVTDRAVLYWYSPTNDSVVLQVLDLDSGEVGEEYQALASVSLTFNCSGRWLGIRESDIGKHRFLDTVNDVIVTADEGLPADGFACQQSN